MEWIDTPSGTAYAVLTAFGVELVRLEVGDRTWKLSARSGSQEGVASSIELGKRKAQIALELLIGSAVLNLRELRAAALH